jgi:hypothetical protein
VLRDAVFVQVCEDTDEQWKEFIPGLQATLDVDYSKSVDSYVLLPWDIGRLCSSYRSTDQPSSDAVAEANSIDKSPVSDTESSAHAVSRFVLNLNQVWLAFSYSTIAAL